MQRTAGAVGSGQQPVLIDPAQNGDDYRDGCEQEKQATGQKEPGATESASRANPGAHCILAHAIRAPGKRSLRAPRR